LKERKRFWPFTQSFLQSVASPKTGWKLNIRHTHSKCVPDKNENMFSDGTTPKLTRLSDNGNNPKLQEKKI
jgi:hypothetical protein